MVAGVRVAACVLYGCGNAVMLNVHRIYVAGGREC